MNPSKAFWRRIALIASGVLLVMGGIAYAAGLYGGPWLFFLFIIAFLALVLVSPFFFLLAPERPKPSQRTYLMLTNVAACLDITYTVVCMVFPRTGWKLVWDFGLLLLFLGATLYYFREYAKAKTRRENVSSSS